MSKAPDFDSARVPVCAASSLAPQLFKSMKANYFDGLTWDESATIHQLWTIIGLPETLHEIAPVQVNKPTTAPSETQHRATSTLAMIPMQTSGACASVQQFLMSKIRLRFRRRTERTADLALTANLQAELIEFACEDSMRQSEPKVERDNFPTPKAITHG